jgi:N-acetylneuraminic acid mutarotase
MAIGDAAYIGLGVSTNYAIKKDWWKYDPLTNSWTQKNDFPSSGRYGVATFVIDDMGYMCFGNVGSAYGPNTNELWQYDPQC